MRGRKPIPTAIHLLRGNPGKRRLNEDEPITDTLERAVPVELTDPVAITEWTRTIVPAIEIGVITTSDRVHAIAHCELWATWRAQMEAAGAEHVIFVGPNKHPTPNPARGMANTTFSMLARVDAELGFTPSSRSRVKASKTAHRKKSPIEAFMDRKKQA